MDLTERASRDVAAACVTGKAKQRQHSQLGQYSSIPHTLIQPYHHLDRLSIFNSSSISERKGASIPRCQLACHRSTPHYPEPRTSTREPSTRDCSFYISNYHSDSIINSDKMKLDVKVRSLHPSLRIYVVLYRRDLESSTSTASRNVASTDAVELTALVVVVLVVVVEPRQSSTTSYTRHEAC